ncbi:SDR family oxidoreductase [Azospirillum sp. B4]|uniref:SDR family oxidoreductase n=1 Tax=Azospirillum sp. B4 TaxID=95605 RepID=UPI00034A179A|nr:SDR family oxidoreductase [Azospirillum sp. B4]
MSAPSQSIPGKTVLITGCSSGFGEATARLFADRGWNVVATMRTPDTHRLPARENILVTRLDVLDPASIDAAIAAGITRFGAIDVLVNNAGFGLFGVFEATPRPKVMEQFAVNVFGVMDVTRALLPHFRQRQTGVVINVSSGAGIFTLPMISLYCASKFALEGFSEALSYELASVGVTVKIVEPGGVTSTRFGERSEAEAATATDLADYRPFVAAVQETFTGLRAARAGSTAQEVAETIFTAATDGTDQLRYVATQDIKPLVAARRETSEERYMALMRGQFMPR